MIKKIFYLSWFLNGMLYASDAILRDPMMPGGLGRGNKAQSTIANTNAAEAFRNSHLKMVVWNENSKLSWAWLGNKKVKEGDYLFGEFLVTHIQKDGVYFQDQNGRQYYLAMSKEQNVKSGSKQGTNNE